MMQTLPYHLTARTEDNNWFPLPMHETWIHFKKSLEVAHSHYPIELVSFVLMQNHYHMILFDPRNNIDNFIFEFNQHLETLVKMNNSHCWHMIKSYNYFSNCYRYVYQNPVRAGLVIHCQDYRYSTLNYIISNRNFSIPIHDKFGFKDGYALYWINHPISANDLTISFNYMKPKLRSHWT
jgi:putative transposase